MPRPNIGTTFRGPQSYGFWLAPAQRLGMTCCGLAALSFIGGYVIYSENVI